MLWALKGSASISDDETLAGYVIISYQWFLTACVPILFPFRLSEAICTGDPV